MSIPDQLCDSLQLLWNTHYSGIDQLCIDRTCIVKASDADQLYISTNPNNPITIGMFRRVSAEIGVKESRTRIHGRLVYMTPTSNVSKVHHTETINVDSRKLQGPPLDNNKIINHEPSTKKTQFSTKQYPRLNHESQKQE